MTLGGIYVGMALETFRRFKRYFVKHNLFVGTLEVIFWVLQTIVLYFVLYKVNSGELRLYIFLACLLGFSIYQVLIKRLYQHVLEVAIKVVYHVIIIPVTWIGQTIYQVIVFFINIIRKILMLLWKALMLPFRGLFVFAKWLIPKKVYIKVSQMRSFYSTMVDNYKNRGK